MGNNGVSVFMAENILFLKRKAFWLNYLKFAHIHIYILLVEYVISNYYFAGVLIIVNKKMYRKTKLQNCTLLQKNRLPFYY